MIIWLLNNMSTYDTYNEFIAVIKKGSSYSGEESHSYQAGYFQAFIKNLAHVPQVQRHMQSAIEHFKANSKHNNTYTIEL